MKTIYFPHDCNATQDPKIMQLLMKCGLAGLGIYWPIIETLHQQPEGKITKAQYQSYIIFYTKFLTSDEQVLNNVGQVLIDVGLVLEVDGFITSQRVLDNLQTMVSLSQKRSKAGRVSAQKRYSQKANLTRVEHVPSSVQQIKENKIKENKILNKEMRKEMPDYKQQLETLQGDEAYLQGMADKNQVPLSFVLSKLDDLETWILEKPTRARGRNLKLTLNAWVKRDALAERKSYARGHKPKIDFIPSEGMDI